MADFATVADVELVLLRPITDADEIASVEFGLAIVSAAIRNYTNQYIELVEDDAILLDHRGGPIVFLPELPVVEVASVSLAGTPLVVLTDYKLAVGGMLVRQRGYRSWPIGIQDIEVTYTHGYATIPDDIRGVAARAASRLFQAGLRAEETGGVLGIASKSLGDFSVSYTAEGSAEGSMGASGARVLSLSDKDLLNKYKLP